MKSKEEIMNEKTDKIRKCYQETFTGEAGEAVLNDLKKVCFFERTTFSGDGLSMALKEGSRDVYLYILQRMRNKKKEE